MLKTIIVAAFMAASLMSHAQSWIQVGGNLKSVTCPAANIVWGVNNQDIIWNWTGNIWNRPSPSQRLSQISAAADGTIWGVNTSGEVWKWTGMNWIQPQPSARLKYISVGSGTQIWGVNAIDEVWKWTGSKWAQQNPNARLTQVSAASDGTAYGVNKAGGIFKYNGMDWEPAFDITLKQIAVGSANIIWGVDGNGNVLHWNEYKWERPTPEFKMKTIAAGADGTVWGLDANEQVFQYSAVVEEQTVTFFDGDFSGEEVNIGLGRWDTPELMLSDNQIASVRVPQGMSVTLYENRNWSGRFLTLTSDASANDLAAKNFFKITSSVVIERALAGATPVVQVVPVVTVAAASADAKPRSVIIYQDDFSGASKELGRGDYDFAGFGFGNDQLSSVRIPDGMQVILFENVSFAGRSVTLTKDAGAATLRNLNFNDQASSLRVKDLNDPAGDKPLMVTLYRDDFAGPYKQLGTGAYDYSSLGVGNDQLTSMKIPSGLSVTLYEHGGFKGRSLSFTADAKAADLIKQNFNDVTSSIRIEPLEQVTTAVTAETKEEAPACTMTEDQMNNLVQSVKSTAFRDTKMSTLEVGTKGKCLSVAQVRTLTQLLTFENDKFDFVKACYANTTDQDSYYTLTDLFTFNSTKDDLLKFLKEK